MIRRDHLRRAVAMGLLASALWVAYETGGARAAGIPASNTLFFSGSLETYGAPDNSTHNMQISLYMQGSISSPACNSSTLSITCVNGQFSIPLPANCVQIIHSNPNVLAQVTIDGTPLGMNAVSAVPYAVEADTASNPAPGSALAALQTQVQSQVGILGIWTAEQSAAAWSVVGSANWSAIPGAATTLTVASNATLEMSADGAVFGVETGGTNAYCGFRFVLDGTALENPTWGSRLIGSNYNLGGTWTNWSMRYTAPVAAGQHTVSVQATGWGPSQGCQNDGGSYGLAKLFIIAH